jgi:hypothetical protein
MPHDDATHLTQPFDTSKHSRQTVRRDAETMARVQRERALGTGIVWSGSDIPLKKPVAST